MLLFEPPRARLIISACCCTNSIPIEKGLPSDARLDAVYASLFKQNELRKKLEPYVHRKDASELRKELPDMQQAVLHLRPTRIQTRLYNFYKKLQKGRDSKMYRNFFRCYQDLRPIHNHPACLQLASDAKGSSPRASPTSEQEDEVEVITLDNKWWTQVLKPCELDKLDELENSLKVVAFLHILAHSFEVGDKVIVFSQCLKTLDYLEWVLAIKDWTKHVKSLAAHFPGMKLGGLEKNVDFVRMDGTTSSGVRGCLVDQFNDAEVGKARVFLISSVAGGIGINL